MHMTKILWAKSPAVLWALLILGLLSVPASRIPTINIIDFDKLVHAFVFGVQAYLLDRAFRYPRPIALLNLKPEIAASIITVLYATLSELYQSLIPDRIPEVADAVANALGVLLFYVYFTIRMRLLRRQQR